MAAKRRIRKPKSDPQAAKSKIILNPDERHTPENRNLTGKRSERRRPFLEPRKGPKEAAFIAVKATNANRSKDISHRFQAARQSRVFCALSAQRKAVGMNEKQASLF
ncbi:MAG: hypothetical protein IJ157_11650, partial [Clostridia bacterium]|nr:hypothetical protein [Clostridia bacterium]